MIRIGSTLSAIMHGSLLAVILLGWPVLDFLSDRDWPWLEPERYRRVDVVIYSDKENPWVALGAGAVSFESQVFGQGEAEERGRAPGAVATNSFRAAQNPNSPSAAGGAPNKPSESAPNPHPQIRTEPLLPPSLATAAAPEQPETRDETPQAGQSGQDSGQEGQAEQPSEKLAALGQQTTAETDEEATSTDDQMVVAETEAAAAAAMGEMEADKPVAEESPTAESPSGAEEPAPVTPPSRLHPIMDLQTAALADTALERMRVARDMPADSGGTADQDTGEETPTPSEVEAPARERPAQMDEAAETAREAESTTAEPAAQSDQPIADDDENGQPTTTETDMATNEVDEQPAAAETEATTSEADEQPAAAETEEATSESDEETQSVEAPGPSAGEEETRTTSAERPAEGANSGAGVVIEIAPDTFGVAYLETTIEDADAAMTEADEAELATAEAAHDVAGSTKVITAIPPQDVWKAAPPENPIILANSLASISPAAGEDQLSQVPSTAVGMKLLLRTMPGLDRELSEAIAHPEAPLERPPTERRQQVLERMEAAAERGYAHAQYGVARRYLIGHGTPRDPDRAGELMMHAAQQGHTQAQLALGYLAARGHGVERDLSEAMLWWTLAGEAGNETAARAAEMLEPHLSPDDLLRARREVSSWRASLGTTDPDSNPGGDERQKTAPLQEAIAAGDLAAVHSLLARGEDADGRDIDGRTALINAGWRGDTKIADTLLEVGADPDVMDKEGKTALIWAASNGHTRVVEQLMAAGTELDIQDDKGLTALMRATWNGYTDVVEAIVKAGADAGLRDRLDMSALDYAERQGYDDIVTILKGGS